MKRLLVLTLLLLGAVGVTSCSGKRVHLELFSVGVSDVQGGESEVVDREKLVGKQMPDWTVTNARGVLAGLQPSDYNGKWLLVTFWGYWCPHCVGDAVPALTKLRQEHADKLDKFETLTFHDSSATSPKELDQRLRERGVVEKHWNSKPLSLPILFDSTGATIKQFAVREFPTMLLIDPSGEVVNIDATEIDLLNALGVDITGMDDSPRER